MEPLVGAPRGGEVLVLAEYPRRDQRVLHQVVICRVVEVDAVTEASHQNEKKYFTDFVQVFYLKKIYKYRMMKISIPGGNQD